MNSGSIRGCWGTPVWSVEYYATEEYFRQLAEARIQEMADENDEVTEEINNRIPDTEIESTSELAAMDGETALRNGFVVDTHFVEDAGSSSDGGWDSQEDQLHGAERQYSGFDEPEHDWETWNARIKSPEVGEAYNSSDSTNYIEAWNVANAGSGSEEGVLSTSASGEDSIFEGGFAGKCPADQTWQYEGDEERWECSGNIPWDQAYTLTAKGDQYGVLVMPYNAYEPDSPAESWRQGDWGHVPDRFDTYAEAHMEAHGESSTLQSMTAECWAGDLNEEDRETAKDDDNYFTEEGIPVSTDNPWGVYGNLDTSNTNGQFSCYWEYETDSTSLQNPVSGVGEIHPLTEDNHLEDALNLGNRDSSAGDVRGGFEEANSGLKIGDSVSAGYEDEQSFVDNMESWDNVRAAN